MDSVFFFDDIGDIIEKDGNEYLGNAMQCTKKVMELVASVIGLDIVELWTEDDKGKLRCTYVYATEPMKERSTNIIVGHYPNHTRKHVVSPTLCKYARQSKTRHYWKVKEDSSIQLEADCLNWGVQTELCYFLQIEDNIKVFIVGLIVEKIPFKSKLVKFMAGISYSIYIAAFDMDDDDEDYSATSAAVANEYSIYHNDNDNTNNTNNDDNNNNAVDNMDKAEQYIPRSVSNNQLVGSLMKIPEFGKIVISSGGTPTATPSRSTDAIASLAALLSPVQNTGVDTCAGSSISSSVSSEYVNVVIQNNNFSPYVGNVNAHAHAIGGIGNQEEHIQRGRAGSAAFIEETLRRNSKENEVAAGLYDALPVVASSMSRTTSLTDETNKVNVNGSVEQNGDGTAAADEYLRHSDINNINNNPKDINFEHVTEGGSIPDSTSVTTVTNSSVVGGEISGDNYIHIDAATDESLVQCNAPTWDPVDSFSFPVVNIPVTSEVPSNLLMEHFTDIQYIADGSNANIFLAKFNNEKVVIKMIKEEICEEAVAVHEFNVEHGMLSRISHPNIIQLLGAGKIPRQFVVLEWLGGGTLSSVLQQNQVKPGLAQRLFRRPSFTYNNLLLRAKDIADALDFLNTSLYPGATVIHRDLKPDNIGFTVSGQLKLFDFGLCTCVKSRQELHDTYHMTGNTGSLRYMAPEVASKLPYNEKADVHSFGIMLWQMARDRVPFKGMSREQFMQSVVLHGDRPKLDKSWPKPFSDLLLSCWHPDHNMRPSFKQLSDTLQSLLDAPLRLRIRPNVTGTSASTGTGTGTGTGNNQTGNRNYEGQGQGSFTRSSSESPTHQLSTNNSNVATTTATATTSST